MGAQKDHRSENRWIWVHVGMEIVHLDHASFLRYIDTCCQCKSVSDNSMEVPNGTA
jgi:hypothetical protein